MSDLFRPRWREDRGPLRLIVQPTMRFMRIEAAGGIVIVLAALIALIWANVDHGSYEDFWLAEITLDLHILTLTEPLEGWVNDLLMVVFFFVIGMEIKREAMHGQLRDPRQAALPIAAAAGGMIVPALFFTAFNAGGEGGAGWGIPVATDIAFALGVLALVGNRVPIQLKVFLLTLAVADDIGGILIIAFFYTDELALEWLAGAAGAVAFIFLMQRLGIRPQLAYLVAGGFLWLSFFESGVEATLAGVILGLMTPADPLYEGEGVAARMRRFLMRFEEAHESEDEQVREAESAESIRGMEHVSWEAMSPLEHLEEQVAPFSAFVIVPIFAMANAGIELGGGAIDEALSSNIAWGVAAGLVAGKFVGVLSACYIAIRTGVAVMPPPVRWIHIAGVSLLAGIGFTVAIFIATLSYDESALIEEAKIGIFAASVVAAIGGFVLLRSAVRDDIPLVTELAPVEPSMAPADE